MTLMHSDTFNLDTPTDHYLHDWLSGEFKLEESCLLWTD